MSPLILGKGDEGEDTIYHDIPPPETLGWIPVFLLIIGSLYLPVKRLRFVFQEAFSIRTDTYLKMQQVWLIVHMISNALATLIVSSHIFAEGGLDATPGFAAGFNASLLMIILCVSGFILWKRFPVLAFDESYEKATRQLHVQILGFVILLFSLLLHVTALQNTVPPSCGRCHTLILHCLRGML